MSNSSLSVALVRSAHPGPTVAVTVLAALLAVGAGHDGATTLLLVTAVLFGQLSIGWSNDLIDADRDRQVRRRDKPLATGDLALRPVRVALVVVLGVCVVASLACGLASGITHLVLGVGSGWSYNAVLKRTVWSWLPYALAFGTLPAVVELALSPPGLPPAWMMVTGALLGAGAHLVNVLPDLEDDAATGVAGLPHRLGRRRSQVAATILLTVASAVAVSGPAGAPPAPAWAGLGVVVLLAGASLASTGRKPFRVAVAIAAIDVMLLLTLRQG